MKLFAVVMIISGFAGFTQGLTGFGSVLVSLPLLAFFFRIQTVVPLVSLSALCISVLLTVELRHHLRWRRIAPLLLTAIPGIPVGVHLLKTVSTGTLQALVGVVLVSYSLYMLLSNIPARALSTRWGYLSGFLSGCLGGSIGAAGPPVIIYTSLQPWDKDAIKSTLVGYFVMLGAMVSLSQGLAGLITRQVLILFAVGLVPLIAGVWLGSHCYRRIPVERYRKVITALVMLLGWFMLGKAIAGL